MKVAINYEPTFAGMAIWFYEERPDGSRRLAKPMELEFETFPVAAQVEPTLRLSKTSGFEFLNSLVNALVKAGFKPDEIKASDKEVVAIKYHLEDMRNIVTKKLGLIK